MTPANLKSEQEANRNENVSFNLGCQTANATEQQWKRSQLSRTTNG
jgi:hypothetical protein